MNSKNILIKKHVLKFGILLGITSVIFGLIIYVTGYYTKQNLYHATFLLCITIVSIMGGLLNFKKNNAHYISLGESLKIGIGISIIGGLLVIIWKILLLNVIDPEIVTHLEDAQIKRIAEESHDFTQENIERKIEITKKYTSPLLIAATSLFEDLIGGFLISLIGGLIIRKKRDPFK